MLTLMPAPYQPPKTTAAFRADPVAYHGEAREDVYPGRRAVDSTWPAVRPEDCTGIHPTRWIANDTVLICTGCGLDCT